MGKPPGLCGMVGLGKRPDFYCHNLERQIGAFTCCIHGEGLAVVIIPYCRWLLPCAIDSFTRFAVNVWRPPSEGSNELLRRPALTLMRILLPGRACPSPCASWAWKIRLN